MNYTPKNKGEAAFINEFTRTLLVDWCKQSIATGEFSVGEEDDVFFEYARAKGWVSKKAVAITGKGFQTAASFLKR